MDRYSTIADVARSKRAARTTRERSHPASSSLPVVAARRVDHPAGDRGPGRRLRNRRVVRRATRRGRGPALARLGRGPPRDPRAASADPDRVAGHRARVRRRRGAGDDRRITSTVAIVGALLATVVCRALASGHDIASAAANALAYGDEQRFPLRVPPALFLGPLPLARLLVVGRRGRAGRCCSPTGEIVLGAVALVVGMALVVPPEPFARIPVAPVGGAGAGGLRGGRPTHPGRPHALPPRARPPRGARAARAGDARHPRPPPRGRTRDRCRWGSTPRSSWSVPRADAAAARRCTTAEIRIALPRATRCSAWPQNGDCRCGSRSGSDTTTDERVAVVQRDHLPRRDPRLRRTRTERRAVEHDGDRFAVRAHLRSRPSRAA